MNKYRYHWTTKDGSCSGVSKCSYTEKELGAAIVFAVFQLELIVTQITID